MRNRKWQHYRDWWIESNEAKWKYVDIVNAVASELATLDGGPVLTDEVVTRVRALVEEMRTRRE